MNTRQIIAIIGVLVVLGLIAYALSFIAPQRPAANEATDLDSQVRAALGVGEAAHITIEAEERDYYALGVYPNGLEAGGGYIAIVHDTGSGVEVIAQGQEAPACAAVEPSNVPLEIISHCMNDQGELIERALD